MANTFFFRNSLGLSFAVLAVLAAPPARAQNGLIVADDLLSGGNIGGVYIDADGTLRHRESDAAGKIGAARARGNVARGQGAVKKDAAMAFVSLPSLFEEVRSLAAAGKPVREELRYLGGITQVQYVLVYPAERDLVIAGPAEKWDSSSKAEPVGRASGRPVVQFDDLVVAMRVVAERGRARPFGCSIDPAPGAQQKSRDVMKKYGARPRQELMAAMAEALGPQQVRVFGWPAETRGGFVLVAADYKLKRMALGIDSPPVVGLGSAVDNSRSAGNRFWFEAMYDPMLVAADGSGYQLRGQRLKLQAGALQFDPRGATGTAKEWAASFTRKMGALAAGEPLFAELQNMADVMAVAALIRQDGLDRKVGWDPSWALASGGYAVAAAPVAKTADTLVNIRNGALAAGGVSVEVGPLVAEGAREVDRGGEVDKAKALRDKAKGAAGSHGSIVFSP